MSATHQEAWPSTLCCLTGTDDNVSDRHVRESCVCLHGAFPRPLRSRTRVSRPISDTAFTCCPIIDKSVVPRGDAHEQRIEREPAAVVRRGSF
jgi:hypothetical protein